MEHTVKIIIKILILLLVVPLTAGETGLRGFAGKHVVTLNIDGLSLTEKLRTADKRFLKEHRGDYYLTGYRFEAQSNRHGPGNMIISENAEVYPTIERSGNRLTVTHFGTHIESRKPSDLMDQRDLILLHKRGADGVKIVDVSILSTDCTYRVGDIPFYYLGRANTDQSLALLKALFKNGSEHLKKHTLSAIAFHNHSQAGEFLYRVGDNTGHPITIRKSAIFWLGIVRTPGGFEYLKKIRAGTSEHELIKAYIFAIYSYGSQEAVAELIHIAKNDPSLSLRKKAIFWLGQKASKLALKTLKEVIHSKDELSVKSTAVFAISQLPHDEAIPTLIDIAKTHKSAKIRKKAMFWLGQTGDDRALTFFENILLKD